MRAVLAQFRVAFRAALRHYERVRKTSSVTGAQLWLLAEVAEAEGASVGDLAHRLSIHQSTASNLVRALESARLVERRQEDDDRRVVRVYSTPQGTRVLRKAPKPLRGVLQQALCDLPIGSLDRLHREMAQLLRLMNVSEASGASTPLLGELMVRKAGIPARRRTSKA